MMNKNVTAYIDEDTYKNLEEAKISYAKEKGIPNSEVKMSEFVRNILREYLKKTKKV